MPYAPDVDRLPIDLSPSLRPLQTLEDVMHWMHAHHIPLRRMERVVQDEFSHDVLVPLADARWLVFGAT